MNWCVIACVQRNAWHKVSMLNVLEVYSMLLGAVIVLFCCHPPCGMVNHVCELLVLCKVQMG